MDLFECKNCNLVYTKNRSCMVCEGKTDYIGELK